MSNAPQPTQRTSKRTLVIALVAVGVLLISALVGGEAYARHTISQCVSSQFEKQMGSKINVGFGWKPLLITQLDGKLSRMDVDSEDSKFGPAVGMVVHARFNDVELKDNGKNGATIGSSSSNVTWSDDGIKQTLAGMVSGVKSSSSTGTITLDVLGGLAQLSVQPKMVNGAVQVDTTQAQILGVGLPTSLVSGIVNAFSLSLQSYPLGMKATEIKVTDNGLAIRLEGGRTELQPASGNNTSTSC